MTVNGHWHIGHNLAGYLPESDVACVVGTWGAAFALYVSEASYYAVEDDEASFDEVSALARDYPADYPRAAEGDFGDETPSMYATVAAILKDDGPVEGQEHGMMVEDGRDRDISFWLVAVSDEDCDHEGCDHDA